MKIEFRDTRAEGDLILCLDANGAPRKGDTVYIADRIYRVETVSWAVDNVDKDQAPSLRATVMLMDVGSSIPNAADFAN